METLSALLALCAGISPVTGELPSHKPVRRSFHIFFDLNKGWVNNRDVGDLRRHHAHYAVTVYLALTDELCSVFCEDFGEIECFITVLHRITIVSMHHHGLLGKLVFCRFHQPIILARRVHPLFLFVFSFFFLFFFFGGGGGGVWSRWCLFNKISVCIIRGQNTLDTQKSVIYFPMNIFWWTFLLPTNSILNSFCLQLAISISVIRRIFSGC